MPNHITNRVKIINLHSKDPGFTKYFSDIEDSKWGEKYLDFEKVIPIPADIKALDDKYNDDHPDIDCRIMSEEFYHWCCDNWDTKWNSYYMEITDPNDIEFSTAWSNCQNVLVEMSKQNPYWIIEVEYYDENLGENLGVYYLNNGNILDDITPKGGSIEAYSLLEERFGMDIIEYTDGELPVPPIRYEIFYEGLSLNNRIDYWERTASKNIIKPLTTPIKYF